MSRKQRDPERDGRDAASVPETNAGTAHPVSRPALQGHVFRRHLPPAASSERR